MTMEWAERASCRGENADLFFPVGSDLGLEQTAAAKAVCSGCPARRECLAWAMSIGPVEGIWGGTTESERRAARPRQRARTIQRVRRKAPRTRAA